MLPSPQGEELLATGDSAGDGLRAERVRYCVQNLGLARDIAKHQRWQCLESFLANLCRGKMRELAILEMHARRIRV